MSPIVIFTVGILTGGLFFAAWLAWYMRDFFKL